MKLQGKELKKNHTLPTLSPSMHSEKERENTSRLCPVKHVNLDLYLCHEHTEPLAILKHLSAWW